MNNSTDSHDGARPALASGPGPPRLPAPLLGKIRRARRLLGEISRDLGLPPSGPGGGPVIPPGLVPGERIPRHEVEQVLDAIHAGISIRRREIRIAGVEMTQSIQFFNLDGMSSGEGNDNTVPLVANKDLVLRVYVEAGSGTFGSIPEEVTGRVRFGGREFAPLNGPLRPRERRLLRRANLDHTLNFRIPAALCRGSRTFQVTVFDPAAANPLLGVGIYADGSGRRAVSTSRAFTATFRDVPPMRVVAMMVRYAGPLEFDFPAPPGVSLVETLSRFLPMLPIHGFDFGPCVPMTWGNDMRIASGDRFSGWDTLLTELRNLRNSSTMRAFYVALLPAKLSEQIGAPHRGIGGPGVAIAARDDTRAMSHELGHATRLDHIDAGGPEGPFDAKYPKYREGTFPFGSIGEFGLDTARMTLFDPSSAGDFMTYLDRAEVLFPAQTWISPYHYLRMMNELVQTDGAGEYPANAANAGPMMLLNFRLYRDGRVELLPSYPVTGVAAPRENRPARAVMLDLIGADGEVLRTRRCHEHNPYQDPDGPYLDFHEVVPWSEEVARLAVVRQGEAAQMLEIEPHAPRIQLGELRRVQRNAALARLEWTTGSTAAAHHALIRYSHDDGRTWQAIAAGVTDPGYLVNLDLLPGGERCRLQVIVSSGLRAAVAQTEPFAVPHKPRKAHLLSPREGEVFRAGAPVRFLGGGHSPDGGTCAFDEVAWLSSLEGPFGTGYHVLREDLRPGTHRITLSLPDGAGGEATAGVWIKIAEDGDGPADCAVMGGHQTLGWRGGTGEGLYLGADGSASAD